MSCLPRRTFLGEIILETMSYLLVDTLQTPSTSTKVDGVDVAI